MLPPHNNTCRRAAFPDLPRAVSIGPGLRVKKHFDTFRENLRIFTEEEKDCGLLKISQFSGRNPDQTNCFSAACALEKPDATYTPPRLIHLDVLRNLF